MSARDYYTNLQNIIHALPHVLGSDMRFEEIDVNECYIKGILTLIGGFELHIAEYVITDPVLTQLKYRYHLQTADGSLVSRWDNAPHHPNVSTHPNHCHDEHGGVHSASPMSIPDILDAVLRFIMPLNSD